MRYVILSDVHGYSRQLEAVLADARNRGAAQVISLGDVGGDDCLALLSQVEAKAVFGNYEVSGWKRLAPEHKPWVQNWPPLLAEDTFLAAHAAPWCPAGVHTIEDFGRWLKRTGKGWRSLFPYLTDDEDYLWQALAELESADKGILFHGHTHEQAVWCFGPTGRLRQIRGALVDIKPDHRYVVGVGSVGLPEDDSWAAYTLYDSDAGRIELMRLDRLPASPIAR